VEERGRILIPKEIREKIGLKGGEKMRVKEKNGEVVLKPIRSGNSLKSLKGIIKNSETNPMEAKNIWDE